MTFQAYIVGREGEQITTNTGAGTGGFQFDLAAFATQWGVGETLTVDVQNPGNGQTGSDSVALGVGSATLNVQLASVVACTYAINPTSAPFGPAGGNNSVAVTAAAQNCDWTAVSNAGWIHVTGGSPGTGNGTVTYSVDANPNSAARQGTVTIAGETFTVNQDGVTCTYGITPTSRSFGSAGGNNSVAVTAAAQDCGWTAASNAGWIHVTGGTPGTGDGTVNYSVDPNSNGATRTGTVTIAGKTFTVTQTGVPCSYSLVPTQRNHPYTSDSGSVNVQGAPSDCAWTAVPNAGWISITSGNSGTGDGSFNYSVTQNPTAGPRVGTINVAGTVFTINQAAGTDCSQRPDQNELIGKNQELTFNWCPEENVAQYQLWIAKKAGLSFLPYRVEWVGGTVSSWTPDFKFNCGQYKWWVRAQYNNGQFGPWGVAALFEVECCDVAKPLLLNPVGQQAVGGALTYSWEAQECANWYQIWVNKDRGIFYTRWINTGFTGGTIEHVIGGHAGGSFEWWVRAYGPEGGYGPWSDPKTFSVALLAPTSLTRSTLCWDESGLGDATWVLVWINQGIWPVLVQWVDLATLTDNCFALPQPLPSGTYTVWLLPWNFQTGRGAWSKPVDFTVDPN